MAIGKKLRFEIFKKDDFTCRYCGKTPPDTTLEVDHIIPKSKGGEDDVINLITSCFDCNRGKGARKLDKKLTRPDVKKINKELARQIKEMEEYSVKMFIINDLKKERLKEVVNYWYENISSYISPRMETSFRGFLADFDQHDLIEAMDIAKSRVYGWSNVFRYMCGILHNWRNNGKTIH